MMVEGLFKQQQTFSFEMPLLYDRVKQLPQVSNGIDMKGAAKDEK